MTVVCNALYHRNFRGKRCPLRFDKTRKNAHLITPVSRISIGNILTQVTAKLVDDDEWCDVGTA